MLRGVDDRDVEHDDVRAAAEDLLARGLARRGDEHRQRRGNHERAARHYEPQRGANRRTSFRVTSTSSFVAGINDSGWL